jgi:hypothetical protein
VYRVRKEENEVSGDYNFKKKCSDEKCGWANVYNSKDDFRHMEALEVCPKCGKTLIKVSYKPIT